MYSNIYMKMMLSLLARPVTTNSLIDPRGQKITPPHINTHMKLHEKGVISLGLIVPFLCGSEALAFIPITKVSFTKARAATYKYLCGPQTHPPFGYYIVTIDQPSIQNKPPKIAINKKGNTTHHMLVITSPTQPHALGSDAITLRASSLQ